MEEKNITTQNIDYIAINTDQKSYTGMRILHSFCLGVSLATGIRIVDITDVGLDIDGEEKNIANIILGRINKQQFVNLQNLHLVYI